MTVESKEVSVKKIFNIKSSMKAISLEGLDDELNELVPDIDEDYCFDCETTEAIIAGFHHNKHVLIQGYHGTGKSTHIEQVAARLGWPCIRINLDGHISRIDLIGKDAIVLKEGKQVTEFKEGLLPWSIQRPVAIVLDEYDAGRPDVMFILQRILESDGKFTLTDKNKVLKQHNFFRIFATANTIGLGDTEGIYHGTNPINQGQLDRWNIVAQLNYLPKKQEEEIVLAKVSSLNNKEGKAIVKSMVNFANMTRSGFKNGDLSNVMSPRSVIIWAENYKIFDDLERALKLSFINKCEHSERSIVSEYYQRCFGEDLADSSPSEMKIV